MLKSNLRLATVYFKVAQDQTHLALAFLHTTSAPEDSTISRQSSQCTQYRQVKHGLVSSHLLPVAVLTFTELTLNQNSHAYIIVVS